jgi:1-acyl-sn-glycerol-3-phosphate acyltransferase
VQSLAATPEDAGELVENTLWPVVEGEFRRLYARPGLIAAAIAALGVGGGVAVRRRRRRPKGLARLAPSRWRRR